MKPVRPPQLARWILQRLLSNHPASRFIIAELEEDFGRQRAQGSSREATVWYWRNAIRVGLQSRASQMGAAPGRFRGDRSRFVTGDSLLLDIKYAWRTLRRQPLHTITIVVTAGLAIGSNTAVFTIVNGVWLRPLPYTNPEELVAVGRSRDGRLGSVSHLDFRDWQRASESLESAAAYSLARETWFGDGEAEEWEGLETTPELFDILGVNPLLGRGLQPGPDDPGVGTGIVLSHALWHRRFGADSGVIGRVLDFEDQSLTVVGVMPEGFGFPTDDEEYWAPLTGLGQIGSPGRLDNRSWWFLRVVGRLRPSATHASATEELTRIAADVDAANAVEDGGPAGVQSLRERYVGDTRMLFLLLSGAVAVVLGIACANIANLGLTSAAARRREFAVRTALGASARRIAKQTLIEYLLLMVIGGALGIVASRMLVDLFVMLAPDDLPRSEHIVLDRTVLLFTLIVTVVASFLIAAVPAWQNARANVGEHLREGSGRLGVTRGRGRIMSGLAVAQLALAVILTTGAGMLLHSFLRVSAVDPGVDRQNVLTMQLQLPRSRYAEPDLVAQYYRDVFAALEGLPQVRSASFSSHLPFSQSNIGLSYYLPGDDPEVGDRSIHLEVVEGDYFATVGIPLGDGRSFDVGDRAEGPFRVVINETMAKRHWPDRSPVGQRITFDDDFPEDRWMTVIGVVADVRKRGLEGDLEPTAYVLRSQMIAHYQLITGRNGYLAVRSNGEASSHVSNILALLRRYDPHVPFTNVRTMDELVALSIGQPRFRTTVIGAFAALALLLALVGIYGVIAFGVQERRHEIGVRMALGASSDRVVRHVVGRGVRLAALGLAIGLAVTLGTGRALESFLFGIPPNHAGTLAVVVLGFGLLTITACYLPARRASRLNPLDTLRQD